MENYPSLSSSGGKSNCNNDNTNTTTTTINTNNNHDNSSNNSNERKMLARSLTQPQGTIEYVVTANDTLNSVAARFQTTPSELARINKITNRHIWPTQKLYVPKRNHGHETERDDAPPNTPNESNANHSSNSDSNLENPIPGQAKRVLDNSLFQVNTVKDYHHGQLQQTLSSPISTFAEFPNATLLPPQTTQQPPTTPPVNQIDPADRECLERFLKINVRHITDGQGVVTGVLLVTPNALMFDPNVSDPLVIEHGTEIYGVTVPMELVLKTALYTDIAHMRVKHAPGMVPMAPKPAVYYASDEESGGIFEENKLLQAYGKKSVSQFDTIALAEQLEKDNALVEGVKVKESVDSNDSQVVSHLEEAPIEQNLLAKGEINNNEDTKSTPTPNQANDFVCDSDSHKEDMDSAKIEETFEDAQDDSKNKEQEICQDNVKQVEEEPSIDLTETFSESGSLEHNKSDVIYVSTDEERSPGPDSSFGTSPQQSNRLSSYFHTKLTLAERHSAPLSTEEKKDTPPPLVSAISAEESCESTVNKRRSAHGESRREQMLKRLSNPVDTIGSITKSGISSGINATKTGFNVTKSGISTGLNVTKSGISTGILATKSGLTTGLNVTKTGFNKVLSTPKNLMDFSSGLVRDAKGALGTGSKSDQDLSEHTSERPKRADSSLGYTNMVDTKVDAFDNFDKLLPRPARHSKDPPLYLCIRMGKHTKVARKNRFSPTFSFGKKKYEREYWFSVPKEKAKNLYHFFQKWAPDIYGDVNDLNGCEARGLEPLTTDDEMEDAEEGGFETELTKGDGQQNSGDGSEGGETGKSNTTGGNKNKFWRRRSPLDFLRLVEDHFSTETTDWNISNSSEEHSFSERFGSEPTEPILPELTSPSELLNVDIIKNLSKHLPARAEGYDWTLIYSTSVHGFSLNTLYREMKRYESPVLLIVEDTNGAKFGALLSCTLKLSELFYGTGETFLFTFYPEFMHYPWTGENLFFIKGNIDSLSIGAGEGNFGLWLDGDLYHGSSHPCKTFGNPTALSSEEDFVVKSIECWGFV